uniref:4-coumarate--CoA ligase n=1 Tax=Strigomonas galati TaxID=1003336 RepID=T1YUB1_9TRYP|nr:4-coumarate--CoA ligase [Strigomonas galati]
MFRFHPNPATTALRRYQLCTAAIVAPTLTVALRHVTSNSTTTEMRYRWENPNAPVARQYISPEGWRVYASVFPSVLGKLDQYPSLYHYMTDCWARAPERTALIQEETKEQLTYQQLQEKTERFAQVLYHYAEVRKGDVVCLMMLNTIYYPIISFGTLRLCGVVTTAAAMNTAESLCHQLEASKTKVIITTHAFRHICDDAAALVKTHTGSSIRVLLLEDLLKMEAPPIPSSYTAMEEAKHDDVAVLPFSSGTTGTPKGVQLTNKNLTVSMLITKDSLEFTPESILLVVLPFFHIYGFSAVLNTAMTANAKQVIMTKYNADTFLNAVQEYKVNTSFIAPPIAVSLAHRLEKPGNTYDFSSMRNMLCSAAPVSEDLLKRLMAKAPGLRMGQGWGMTEMSPTATVKSLSDDSMPRMAVGGPAPDTEMRIVRIDDSQQSGADKSAGIDVEEGKEGEVWLRGPTLMKGYLNKEETALAMQDGWYRTGDIGYVDDRKLLYISGRLKELIKYKGFQVSPPEVEVVLMKHPWVKDCIVLGVPDQQDTSFENPRALVVLVDNLPQQDAVRASDEIYRYMMRKMPPHKRLHGGVRIVDEIMKNATGKPMRRQQRMAELEYIKQTSV